MKVRDFIQSEKNKKIRWNYLEGKGEINNCPL